MTSLQTWHLLTPPLQTNRGIVRGRSTDLLGCWPLARPKSHRNSRPAIQLAGTTESPTPHKGELGEYHADTWVQDSVSEVEDVFVEKFPELTAEPSICTTWITQHP